MTTALDGRGRLVLCAGEPGIGKTRLAEELIRLAAQRGAPVAWGRGLETVGPPYWLWQQVLCKAVELLDPAKPLGDASSVAADLVPLIPELGPRLGVEATSAGQTGERLRLFDTASHLLRAGAARDGLVVVLDDLHWADRPSVLLLLHLVRRFERDDTRVLAFATYRDTEAGTALSDLLPVLVGERACERLRLRGLAEDAVRSHLSAVSRKEISAGTARRIHELTGGNPFFVGELGRELRERGELTWAQQHVWHVTVPETVRGAIRRRLARLSFDCQELLRAASVVGREFSVGVVAAMRGVSALVCLDLLDEASAAGLVEPAGSPGRYRFDHEIVRDAVEADLASATRVRLHRAAAEAIEGFFARHIQPHLSDLARHWAVAAAGGDGHTAATWAARAGDEAMRRLAYEEAVRLYRLGLEVGAADLDDVANCDLLLRLARALHRSGELGACLETCQEAAAVARRLSRADLVGEAALVLEAIGEPPINFAVRELCQEALRGLGDEAPALRARLLAQLTEACCYLGDTHSMDPSSRKALELAERSGDPTALVTALRSRHLACSVPEGLSERLALADRLVEVARGLPTSEPGMWAHVWRIAAFFERGELAAVAGELPRLARSAEQVRTPLARWHLCRNQAILAQAQGRFEEAQAFAVQALDVVQRIDHPFAQHMYYALVCMVGHHTSPPADLADEIDAFPGDFGPLGKHLVRALVLVDSGRPVEAAAEYRRLGPVTSWEPSPFLRLMARAVRLLVAVGVEEAADVATLLQGLGSERGRHVAGVGGGAIYLGPAELYLGVGARFLGHLDDAVADLEVAADVGGRSGARPFVVEADYELACALAERAGPGDLEQARSILADCRTAAAALGMKPFVTRSDRLLVGLGASRAASGLSTREMQAAELVARGLTNREIAAALVISERTAQNHVQHILTKLGFSTRSQIAAWFASRVTGQL